MYTVEKTKTYRCGTCDKTWVLEWIRGSVTNETLFPLSREAPNWGNGHVCKACGGAVIADAA